MSLKPVKSLGQRYQAKIFKHYARTENLTSVGDTGITITYFKGMEALVFYPSGKTYVQRIGVYDLVNNKIISDMKDSNYFVPIEYNKIYSFTNVYDNKQYVVGYFEKEYQDWELNTLVVRQVIRYAKDKSLYYALQTFNYIPIDDISETTNEHIRGNIMKEETRSIRWDYDNVPLEENDIVQLENGSYYMVQDIITKQRVGFNTYKSYTAMLYKVGV